MWGRGNWEDKMRRSGFQKLFFQWNGNFKIEHRGKEGVQREGTENGKLV